MLRKIKHVIWDWNGTLLDDVELCVNIINGLLKNHGLKTLSVNEYKNIFTFPVKEYYAKAGFDFEKYPFEQLGKKWIEEYEHHRLEAKLFKGAEEALQYIAKNAKAQSILSAYSQKALIEIVDHFNLRKYFSNLVGLDNIYANSKLDLGKKLMKDLRNGKGEVLLIGDTVHDYEVAVEIGAECILIANGHQSKDKLLACGVPVFNSLEDIFI